MKNTIFRFLKSFVLSVLDFLVHLMALLFCLSLGYFVGIMIGTAPKVDSMITIGAFSSIISMIFFPLFFFYLCPMLRIKWNLPLIDARFCNEGANKLFIDYYESKKGVKIIEKDKTYTNAALEAFLLKIPIIGRLYIKKRDFNEKMKDTSFALGYTLKWIKRKGYFGLSLLFILCFIQMTWVLILFPQWVFGIIFGLFLLTTSFLLTLHVDFYILKKLYKQLDKETQR